MNVMKKIITIIVCLLLANNYSCFAHSAKIGRFECISGTRMSVYACGASPTQWDYIYIDSPWITPFFIEKSNMNDFLNYTKKAITTYTEWTSMVAETGSVQNYHKHIDYNKDIMVMYYSGYGNYNLERKHKESKTYKISYDFFVNGAGVSLLECNVFTTYNHLSLYLDSLGMYDFIYILEHATERYLANPNVKTESAIHKLLNLDR